MESGEWWVAGGGWWVAGGRGGGERDEAKGSGEVMVVGLANGQWKVLEVESKEVVHEGQNGEEPIQVRYLFSSLKKSYQSFRKCIFTMSL